jgi:hypothetical protein
VPSCAEQRRRELLTAALRACKHFKVNILLLPEYSIRPDTVKWLREVLPSFAPATSVWAGTYRVPPQCNVDVAGDQTKHEAGSAVLPVLLQDGEPEPKVEFRLKKYPAVAAGEVFRPHLQTLTPVFQPVLPRFDPRSFVTELICSEVFLVTSPANISGMAHALRDVAHHFRAFDPPPTTEFLEGHIAQDILTFGRHSSLSAAPDQPRLILLVPAMTNRTVDYAGRDIHAIENALLVKIRADLSDMPECIAVLPDLKTEALFRDRFEKVVVSLSEKAGTDAKVDVGRMVGSEIATAIAIRVGIAVAARLGISGGIIGTGSALGPETFGVSIVVGLIVDQIAGWVISWFYKPEVEIGKKLTEELAGLSLLLVNGDEKTRGLKQELGTLAEQRKTLRENALREMILKPIQ